MTRPNGTPRRPMAAVLGLGVALLAWEALARQVLAGGGAAHVLPPPSEVGRTLLALATSGDLARHAGASLGRVLVGYGAAAAVGLPLAWALGVSPGLERQVAPLLRALRPVPPFAWIPLALLWFGIGDASAAAVVFPGAFFTIVRATAFGMERVDPALHRAAANLGARGWPLLRRVLLPASLPAVFAGLRMAWGFAWMSVVAAELVGSRTGLGFLILDSRNLGRPDLALAGMVAIGAIAWASDALIARIAARATPWTEGEHA